MQYLLEAPKDGDLGTADSYSRLGGVLDRVLGPAILAGDSAYGTSEVVALERLDILDLEGLHKYLILGAEDQQGVPSAPRRESERQCSAGG